MTAPVAVHAVGALPEPARRAMAFLAAAVSPGLVPRYAVVLGDIAPSDLVRHAGRLALWWCGENEAEPLLRSTLLRTYIADGTPGIIFARQHGDAQTIAAALE